jgi:hypothetical protein
VPTYIFSVLLEHPSILPVAKSAIDYQPQIGIDRVITGHLVVKRGMDRKGSKGHCLDGLSIEH